MATTKKTTARKAAPRKRGAAVAPAELKKKADELAAKTSEAVAAVEDAENKPNGKAHTIEWRGITFLVPVKLPGSMVFDLAAIEDDRELSGVMGMLKRTLGAGPLRDVQAKLDEDDVSLEEVGDVLSELLENVLGHYGMSAGESAASPAS